MFLGSIGNKTELTIYLVYSLILSIPIVVGYVYFLQLQTYSLIFDLILNIIGLIFIALEVIFMIYAAINIKANEKGF